MTPKEVQEHGFPQARKGYDMAEVDEFLDALTEDYTALFTNYGKLSNSYAKLKKKAQAMAAALEQYQKQGAPAPKAPVVDTSAAVNAADDILRSARKDAEAIRQGAERERQEIIANATGYAAENAERLKAEVSAQEAKLAAAKRATADYIAQVQRVISRQAALLEELPDTYVEPVAAPVVEKVEAPAAETAADMVDEITRQIGNLDYSDDLEGEDLDETRVMAAVQGNEESLFDMFARDQELNSEFDEE